MKSTSPVLFVTFNRPELTFKVFSQIRAYQPAKLYISMDGPRNETEAILVDKVKAIVRVDWECEVFWKTNAENLGCKTAVSSAITWFFNNEAEGIILEDDTLPNPAFFTFCQSMLEQYRNDHSVGHISGSSFIKNQAASTYYFSKYCHSWGWASWSRVWDKYDVEIKDFESLNYQNISEDLFERIYWYEKFRDCNFGLINTWDYQLLFMLWKYNLKSITPRNNLISNIGFNQNATHFAFKNLDLSNLATRSFETINHPKDLRLDIEADKLVFKRIYNRILPSNIMHLFMYFYKYRAPQNYMRYLKLINW